MEIGIDLTLYDKLAHFFIAFLLSAYLSMFWNKKKFVYLFVLFVSSPIIWELAFDRSTRIDPFDISVSYLGYLIGYLLIRRYRSEHSKSRGSSD
jgi:hypothetical protein